MTSDADADDEMREAIIAAINYAEAHTPRPYPVEAYAAEVLAMLRRRGCVFPGDAVSDGMARAAADRWFLASTGEKIPYGSYYFEEMRAAIAAALAKAGTV